MLIQTSTDWERIDRAELVSVGSYSLYASTSGPPRKPGAPVVIFITGGGAPTEVYTHLQRSVAGFARNNFYDRAGYGRSESPADHGDGRAQRDCSAGAPSTGHRSRLWWPASDNQDGHAGQGKTWASDSAHELRRLMRAIGVRPPYVLTAHSYGGIIARTYYDLYPTDVAGLGLLDTASELLQQCLSPFPPPVFSKVVADVDFLELTRLKEASGLSDAEWETMLAAVEKTHPAAVREENHGSGRALARKYQIDDCVMGEKPLLVMGSNMARELRLWFEEAKKNGAGTEEERREAEWWLESSELYLKQISLAQMGMSRSAIYVRFDDVGHDFPIRLPQKTAELIRDLFRTVLERQMEHMSIDKTAR